MSAGRAKRNGASSAPELRDRIVEFRRVPPNAAPKQRDGLTELRSSGPSSHAKARARRRGRST